MDKFRNRYEAGKILADQLKSYAKRSDVIVLALPRGGVPVAFEIAKALLVPLDLFIVRKIGVPEQEELAMGALAMGGLTVFNEELIRDLGISKQAIEKVIQMEERELRRRETAYRGDEPYPTLTGKTIILVDDGIATGASMRAAVSAIRQLNPASIIMAVPVVEVNTYEKMAKIVDKVVCPLKPEFFYAVGQWYDDFTQTTDEEVRELLVKSKLMRNKGAQS